MSASSSPQQAGDGDDMSGTSISSPFPRPPDPYIAQRQTRGYIRRKAENVSETGLTDFVIAVSPSPRPTAATGVQIAPTRTPDISRPHENAPAPFLGALDSLPSPDGAQPITCLSTSAARAVQTPCCGASRRCE